MKKATPFQFLGKKKGWPGGRPARRTSQIVDGTRNSSVERRGEVWIRISSMTLANSLGNRAGKKDGINELGEGSTCTI